ncbi:MAG TPA: MBL fold metallo-hydrolase [Kiritimatiellae bacterium]|nr:MBL fold metallo-hydrolase [Kiritimatiellia bacterium]
MHNAHDPELSRLADCFSRLDNHPPRFRPSPPRSAALLEIGAWLERHVRPQARYDLAALNPHPVWNIIMQRLQRLLERLRRAAGQAGTVVWQWYNSGVLITSRGTVIALDLVPCPRPFGWREPPGLTAQLAELLDVLLITHAHPDHYDRKLVSLCLQRGKPVILPADPAGARDPAPHALFLSGEEGFCEEIQTVRVSVKRALHVWREHFEQVPSLYYDLLLPDGTRMLFMGDGDYTRSLDEAPPAIDWLFVTWRSPNADYEPDEPAAKGSPADALAAAAQVLRPAAVILEHYAELEHVYQGYPASLNLAVEQIQAVPGTDCLFWGEHAVPPRHPCAGGRGDPGAESAIRA